MLLCALCYFENLHRGHNVIKVKEIESLEKENLNINLGSGFNNFKIINEKMKNLKEKIEKEIKKINQLYDKVIKELEKSYQDKHEQLIKEENAIKERLQTEVIKIKEKLENDLSESNNEIKILERINKGVENMRKEEKNMIKNLSYISNINKIKKDTNETLLKLMKNIKISYSPKNNIINYEEYYFNGLLKNVELTNIGCSSLNIICDNNIDLNKNEIKLRIEMKKDNENEKEKFEKIYEGTDNKYSINNLNKGDKYIFKISTLFNDNDLSDENWLRTIKIKTLNCDSLILSETNKGLEFLDKIYEWSGYKQLNYCIEQQEMV